MKVLTGTGRLVALALRRDRIKLSVWVLAIVGIMTAAAPSIREVYGASEASLTQYAATTANSMVARMLGGPIDGPQLGSVMMVEYFLFTAVLIAFMSSLAVVRHTRQNEETGRSELIGSAVVGRYAQLTAALVVMIGANVIVAVLMAAVLIANDMPVDGSIAMAAGLGGVGLVFAAIAAVCAQISGSARGANALVGAVLGGAVLLRALGDGLGNVAADGLSVTSAWLSWLSPIGWGQQMHPFAQISWWPAALFAGVFAALTGLAFWLVVHRDQGAGMVASRSGRAKASPFLLSSIGLAWRLQRPIVIGWAIGVAVLGATLGVTAIEFKDLFTQNEQLAVLLQQMGSGAESLTDVYFAAMMAFMAMAIAGYALQATLRMQSEESNGYLEPVLAASISRYKWMASHLLVVVGSVVFLGALAGATTGLAYAFIADDAWGEVMRLVVAGLVQVPSVLLFVGFAVAMFGVLPRLANAIVWGGFAICLLIVQLGEILKLPDWLQNVSPFGHTPAAPADTIDAAPLIVMTFVALVLIAIGLAAFRRRDLTA